MASAAGCPRFVAMDGLINAVGGRFSLMCRRGVIHCGEEMGEKEMEEGPICMCGYSPRDYSPYPSVLTIVNDPRHNNIVHRNIKPFGGEFHPSS